MFCLVTVTVSYLTVCQKDNDFSVHQSHSVSSLEWAWFSCPPGVPWEVWVCPRQAAEKRQELGLAFGEAITGWAGCTLGNTDELTSWIEPETPALLCRNEICLFTVSVLKITPCLISAILLPKGLGWFVIFFLKQLSPVWHFSLSGLGQVDFEDSCLVVAVLWLLKHCCG